MPQDDIDSVAVSDEEILENLDVKKAKKPKKKPKKINSLYNSLWSAKATERTLFSSFSFLEVV